MDQGKIPTQMIRSDAIAEFFKVSLFFISPLLPVLSCRYVTVILTGVPLPSGEGSQRHLVAAGTQNLPFRLGLAFFSLLCSIARRSLTI